MQIELTIDGTVTKGLLFDHPVAQQLAGLLPLELQFSDFNRVEKVARLGTDLVLDGVLEADSPAAGEIGYYGPTQGLVLYYASPGRWPGLIRMGTFDYDLRSLASLADGSRIRITMD